MGSLRAFQGLHGTVGQPTAQVIDGSLKFQKANSTSLTRTPGSAGNRSVYTGSVWIKRTQFAPNNTGNSNTHNHIIFSAGSNSGSNVDDFSFYKNAGGDDNKLRFQSYPGSTQYEVISNAKYRDPDGWYNVVWNYDGTTAKVYVNGEQITSLDTNTQNGGSGGHFNNTVQHVIGRTCDLQNDGEFDGYMSQFYWIDGLSLGPGYFGFTDPLTNTWRPQKFRAKGTTINDGTVWSNSLTTNAGDNFDGSGAKTKAFDGNGSNKAFTANNSDGTTQGTSYLEMVFPSPISGVLRVKCDNGNTVRNTTNGKDVLLATQSTGSDNQFVHCGTVSGLTNLRVLMSGGSRPAISIIEVDGVVMQDSTTTNLSFGTNGFYLPMDNQDDFEKDKSGNGNDFTKNNFSGTSIDPDVVKDSPSGAVFGGRSQTGITTTSSAPANYATYNAVDNHGNTLSNGNLTASNTAGNWYASFGSIPSSDGRHYFEVTPTTLTTTCAIGVYVGNGRTDFNGNYPYDANTYMIHQNGYIYHAASTVLYQTTYSANDTVGVAVDSKNRKVWISVNGSFVSGENPTTGIGGLQDVTGVGAMPDGEIYPVVSNRSATADINFGQKPFKYAPPQGYLPLNSASVRPNKVVPRPDQYFGITTYTGTGATNRINVGIQPDFVWIKERGGTKDPNVYDTVRGVTKELFPNGTGTENTLTSGLTSFNDNGYTFSTADRANGSGQTYVNWFWKAGGNKNTFNVDGVGYASAAAAGLDGGTLTPSGASVGTKQGFSIIKWLGVNNASPSTISHGQTNQTPKFVIVKNLTDAENWAVYHAHVGNTKYLQLDTTTGTQTSSQYWNDTSPTSTLITLNNHEDVQRINRNYVLYAWSDVPSLQKFGGYIGNGNADGPFVELGFRPALLWVKRTDSTGNWVILDTKRNPFNPVTTSLYADTNEADYDPGQDWADILSNGFKIRATYGEVNASSGDYIYCAWAEQPASNLFGGQSNAR